jgi:hypothetical protein
MGILRQEHFSSAGAPLAPQLRQYLRDEAELLEMAASRINLLPADDREDVLVLVRYLEDAAARLRRLVDEL